MDRLLGHQISLRDENSRRPFSAFYGERTKLMEAHPADHTTLDPLLLLVLHLHLHQHLLFLTSAADPSRTAIRCGNGGSSQGGGYGGSSGGGSGT